MREASFLRGAVQLEHGKPLHPAEGPVFHSAFVLGKMPRFAEEDVGPEMIAISEVDGINPAAHVGRIPTERLRRFEVDLAVAIQIHERHEAVVAVLEAREPVGTGTGERLGSRGLSSAQHIGLRQAPDPTLGRDR
jgi:hypothetical protein